MADFKPAFQFVLQHEDAARAGKVTVDAGGRTRFGIAEKFHPELLEDFFSGPAEEALLTAEKIEDCKYWTPMRLNEIGNQGVASKLLDMAVNMGVRQAVVYAQRAVNMLSGSVRLVEDGVMGTRTLAVVNALNPDAYEQRLCELSVAHYRHVAAVNPAQAVNLQGWLKRAEA